MITEKQKKERQLGIGGSDLPIILGLSSYKTPYELFLEKIGYLTPIDKETSFQEWGNRLEAVVRIKFAENHNIKVHAAKTDKKLSPPSPLVKYTLDPIVHPFYPYLRANLDGFIPEKNCVLEIKCVHAFTANKLGEIGTDSIPLPYLVQVAHYVACTNADGAYIAVLIGGNEYKEFYYSRDHELEEELIHCASDFWEAIQTKTPPPPIKVSDLTLKYPNSTTSSQIITDWAENRLNKLKENRKKIKELEKKEIGYKLELMEYMKTNESLVTPEGKPLITWRTNKTGKRVFLIK